MRFLYDDPSDLRVYENTMSKTTKIKRDFSCGGLVWDPEAERVLLVQVENLQRKRVWTFPKGHPEGQELDEAAALREVLEETGWQCEILKPVMDTQYSYTHKNIKVNKTVRWFLMRPIQQTGTAHPEEIVEARWVDLDQAKKMIIYESD